MTISVPTDKLAGIRALATCLKQRSLVSGRSLAMFIGTATSMKLAIPPAPLFYRALQTAKNLIDLQAQSIDSPVQLGPAKWEELTWWIEQAQLWNGYSLRPPKQVLMIQTDASQGRMGSHVSREIHGRSMVSTGDSISHQLPGIVSCFPCHPDLCQGSKGINSLGPNRQRPDHDLHRSEGWNTL